MKDLAEELREIIYPYYKEVGISKKQAIEMTEEFLENWEWAFEKVIAKRKEKEQEFWKDIDRCRGFTCFKCGVNSPNLHLKKIL